METDQTVCREGYVNRQ